MARRLEASDQKAKDLAKKLGSHNFNNEEGEEYGASAFSGIGDYMRNKRTKIQNRDAQIRAEHAYSHAPLFRGLAIWINGETFPTPYELGRLIVKHSGVRFQYLDGKTQVTHIIASNLTLKKRVEFARYKVVKPEWITESIKAGVLLPWSDFRLVDETPAQRKLSFSSPPNLETPVRKTIDNGGSSRGVVAMSTRVGGRPIAVPGSSFIRRVTDRRLSAAGPSGTEKVADRPIATPRGFETRETVDIGRSLPQPIASPRSPSTRWAVKQPRLGSSLRSKDITIPPSDEPDFEEEDQFPSYQLPANNINFTAIPSYQPQRSFYQQNKLLPSSQLHNSRDYSYLFKEGEKQSTAQEHEEDENRVRDLVDSSFVPPANSAVPGDTTKEYDPVPPKLNTFSLKFSSPPPNTFPPPAVQRTTQTRKTRTSSKPLSLEKSRLEPSPTPPVPSSRPDAVAIINGQKAYEVEAFVDERIHPKRKNRRAWTEYLVSWKGYPLDEASWEPEKQLKQDLKDGEFDRLLREWRKAQWEGSGSESGDGGGKVVISVEIPKRTPGSLNVSSYRDVDNGIAEPAVGGLPLDSVRYSTENRETKKLQVENASGEITYGSTPPDFLEKGKPPLSVDTSITVRPLGDSREIRDSLSPDDVMDEDEDFGWGIEEQRIMDNEGDDLFNKITTTRDVLEVPNMVQPGWKEDGKMEALPVTNQSFESIYGTPIDFPEDFMEETLGEELNIPDAPESTMEDIISPVDFTDFMQEDKKEEVGKLDAPADLNLVVDTESFAMGLLTPVNLQEECETLPKTQHLPEVGELVGQSLKLSAKTPIPPPEGNPHPEMTAEQKMVAYLSNPGIREQTCLNPGFLQKYHEESRLHQLSTWKAKLRTELQTLADAKSSSEKVRPKRSRRRRYILHVDFDCFFAAVSTLNRPDLVGKPVAVTHGNAESSTSSDIASCNYTAREFGVKNGMWMEEAKKLCPGIICLPYEFPKYEDASKTFYEVILSKNAEKVQAVSVDEVLVDVSNLCCDVGLGSEEEEETMASVIAGEIRDSCRERTGGLEVSVGIGGNVLLAKLATKKAKPAGQYLIKSAMAVEFMSDAVVRDLPGIGSGIAAKVEEKLGTNKVSEVRGVSKERLRNLLGEKTGEKLWGYCRGLDNTVVGQTTMRKSVSVDVNWGIRFENQEQAETFLTDIAEEVEKRMKQEGVRGKHLTLKVNKRSQNAPFITPKHLGCGKCDTINRSITLGVVTSNKYIIGKEAVTMLRLCRVSPGELRGLGLTMMRLEEAHAGKADSNQKSLDYFKKEPMKEDHVKKDTGGGNPPAEGVGREQNIPPERPLIKAYVKPRIATLLDSFSKVPAVPKQQAQLIQMQQEFEHSPDVLMGTQIDIPMDVDPDLLRHLPEEYRTQYRTKKMEENNKIQDQKRIEEDLLLTEPPSQPPPGSQYDLEIWKQLGSEMRAEIIAEHEQESRWRARATASPSKKKYLPAQSPRRNRSLVRGKNTSVTPPHNPSKDNHLPSESNTPSKKRGRPLGHAGASANQERILDMKGNDVSSWLFTEGEVDRSWFNAIDGESRQFQIALAVKARELKLEAVRKQELKDAAERERLANAVRLPVPSRQYTLGGGRPVGTVEEIRNTLSDWYECCAEIGPHEADTEEFTKFLRRLILVEHNMAKADEMVRYFQTVVGYEEGEWRCVVQEFAKVVNDALDEMGLGPINFEIGYDLYNFRDLLNLCNKLTLVDEDID